jgi:DNA polymerase III subunit delta
VAKPKAVPEIYPVYLIYGPEDYLVEEEVQTLLNRCLPPKERDLNFHVFGGEEDRIREAAQTARTVPMFSRYRFVLLNAADRVDEEEAEMLMEYIRNPSPTTCLVLRGLSLGPWKGFRSEIEKTGKVIEFGRLKSRSLTVWMRKRMGEKGKALSEEAVNYLVEVIGDDLQNMESVLERISLGIGEKRTVELSDVEGIISEVRSNTIFDLTEAIGRQDLEKALTVLEKAMLSKVILFKKDEQNSKMDDPVPLLLSMMARQYRQIWRVKELSSKGQGLPDIAKSLRTSPWNIEKLLTQAKRFSLQSLRQGILKCHRTDLAVKRGRGPKDLLMEKLVIDLCRPQESRRQKVEGSRQ